MRGIVLGRSAAIAEIPGSAIDERLGNSVGSVGEVKGMARYRSGKMGVQRVAVQSGDINVLVVGIGAAAPGRLEAEGIAAGSVGMGYGAAGCGITIAEVPGIRHPWSAGRRIGRKGKRTATVVDAGNRGAAGRIAHSYLVQNGIDAGIGRVKAVVQLNTEHGIVSSGGRIGMGSSGVKAVLCRVVAKVQGIMQIAPRWCGRAGVREVHLKQVIPRWRCSPAELRITLRLQQSGADPCQAKQCHKTFFHLALFFVMEFLSEIRWPGYCKTLTGARFFSNENRTIQPPNVRGQENRLPGRPARRI